MSEVDTKERLAVIARLNDMVRFGRDPLARVVMTRTCLSAFCDLDDVSAVAVQAELFAAFRECRFADDCLERDFAEVLFGGRRVWMKIDYFDLDLVYGSPDPADPGVTRRVMTILLPEDY